MSAIYFEMDFPRYQPLTKKGPLETLDTPLHSNRRLALCIRTTNYQLRHPTKHRVARTSLSWATLPIQASASRAVPTTHSPVRLTPRSGGMTHCLFRASCLAYRCVMNLVVSTAYPICTPLPPISLKNPPYSPLKVAKIEARPSPHELRTTNHERRTVLKSDLRPHKEFPHAILPGDRANGPRSRSRSHTAQATGSRRRLRQAGQGVDHQAGVHEPARRSLAQSCRSSHHQGCPRLLRRRAEEAHACRRHQPLLPRARSVLQARQGFLRRTDRRRSRVYRRHGFG